MSGDVRMRRLFPPPPPPPLDLCNYWPQLSFNWHRKIIGFEYTSNVALMLPRTRASRFSLLLFFFIARFRHEQVVSSLQNDDCGGLKSTLMQRAHDCGALPSFILYFWFFLYFFYFVKRLVPNCDPRDSRLIFVEV